jgi:nicotinate phosphoribosyltransferase
MAYDTIALDGDTQPGEPLLMRVMANGRRTVPPESLAASRRRAQRELARLPEALRSLTSAPDAYPVRIAPSLEKLAREVDAMTPALPALLR